MEGRDCHRGGSLPGTWGRHGATLTGEDPRFEQAWLNPRNMCRVTFVADAKIFKQEDGVKLEGAVKPEEGMPLGKQEAESGVSAPAPDAEGEDDFAWEDA